MARKKAPIIKGSDPKYTTNFAGGFTPIPTNMPAPAPVQKPTNPPPVKEGVTPEIKKTDLEIHETKPVTAKASREKSRETKQKPEQDTKAKKYVYLFATPQKKHKKLLDALKAKGITPKDVSRIAGRRANALFKPVSKYVPPAVVERLSSQYRYTTTKNVDQSILKTLHETADPLLLKSDATMLQGQFEAIFWEKVEEIYEELK